MSWEQCTPTSTRIQARRPLFLESVDSGGTNQMTETFNIYGSIYRKENGGNKRWKQDK
jgi:hypothetical protein